MYEERTYRGRVRADGLVAFTAVVKETDLFILADSDLSALALEVVIRHRHQLETYIAGHPEFLTSLVPVELKLGAPESAVRMARAALPANVGPMAAVAGTFSELVGEALLARSSQAIVENGGDIYIKSTSERVVALYAGDSPLSGRVGLNIRPGDTPLGVCTSSGRVGHSLSLGRAHAACIISKSTALADAAATAVGNAVQGPGDVEKGIARAQEIEGVLGAVVIAGDRLAAWGLVELVKL
ncbi:MAG: UPF0280 family protein [Nitrospirae bacterium]|nr:UPF0280 family protein [Nitrospirota bacterium]MBI5694148.1 UPF0280 family protein [Nitrospirota bacterium]